SATCPAGSMSLICCGTVKVLGTWLATCQPSPAHTNPVTQGARTLAAGSASNGDDVVPGPFDVSSDKVRSRYVKHLHVLGEAHRRRARVIQQEVLCAGKGL